MPHPEFNLGGSPESAPAVATFYRELLLDEVTPFWLEHGLDREHGGYFTALGREGELLQTDKSVWFLGRMAWMFCRLIERYGPREEWLHAAQSGVAFMESHAFDTDGRMFFTLTREGAPLRKRRYLFSECFAIIALAAYAKVGHSARHLERAESLLKLVLHYRDTPGMLSPKVDPTVRPSRGLSLPMILLVTAQELRRLGGDRSLCQRVIDDALEEIRLFVHPEFRAVLEMVGPRGEFIDTLEGRCLNPGHALEAGWFILEEARVRGGDLELTALGREIIDWSLERGWDEKFGGILYFRDAKGLPCTEYWHDMKFWWPQNEALLAALYAWRATGDPVYATWHDKIARWAFSHFSDAEHGEWYGYLHRDGSVSTPVKGSMFKGYFHLPRMLLLADEILCGPQGVGGTGR